MQKPGIIIHNPTIQKLVNSQPELYQNDNSGKSVAIQKNYLPFKRLLDILFSVLIILLVLSWLLPIISFLIKLDSEGPVFFKQKRIGLNGNPFTCLKLRTMILNNEADETPACKNDHRITRFGFLLRRSNIDELPQFFNVLAGQMSIVGPRPHMVSDCIRFSFVIPLYASRHLVKPGLTGWAQVKGYHGPTSDYESIINRYYWDIAYVRQSSLWLDARIIALTIAGGISAIRRVFFKAWLANKKIGARSTGVSL
ncbi:MAG: sugar transferase [Chitinophagaceae bacterium]